ncbi:MAG TPA: BatD family protein, partial [Bacteroidota bacterium]|nr:BatD family protein [Bacteroidota bacterium]
MSTGQQYRPFGAIVLAALSAALCVRVSTATAAQDVTFQTSVDRTSISMGERVSVGFVLSGSRSGNNFQQPDFRDFTVLTGPNTSTGIQMINGSVSSSLTYGYLVEPKREGQLTIGPATIDVDGNRYATAPVTITVGKAAGSQPRAGGQPGVQATGDDAGGQIGDNLLLRLELDRRTVYQGEQITAAYKIYTRVNVVNYNLSKVPAFTGFWSEDIGVPQQVQLATETFEGKQYRVGVLKKVALFPQRSGLLEVGPMSVECVVQVQSRRKSNDIFDQFFNDPFFGNVRNVNYTVATKAEKVTVKPLPADGIPAGFGGAVGSFSMESGADKQQVSENEAVTYRVKISGTGNIKLLEAPGLNLSPDIDRYDPKVSDQISTQKEKISGTRTFEYLLIPRHAGAQRIPPVSFSYFDPDKKAYVTITGKDVALSVSKGSAGAEGLVAGAGISREDIRLLGEDIRFIKSDDVSLEKRGRRFAGSSIFFVSAAA